jgi:hypothetical protein
VSALDDILGALPADAISQQVGASPDDVRAAAAAVLPALLGGLQANASDPSGADSILEALGQHQDDLLSGGADLSAINESDGQAITNHIFGDREEDVVNRLGEVPAMGGSGMGGALVKKLLPILAPMVCPGWPSRCWAVLAAAVGAWAEAVPLRSGPTPPPACRAPRVARPAARAPSTTCCVTSSAARRAVPRRPHRVAALLPPVAWTPGASSATSSAGCWAAAAADR